ncbi:MAG: Eco57I restriction-modification methylase domain-containing protein, partial [Gemmatimonadota bacterium]
RTSPVDPSVLLAADDAPGVAELFGTLGFAADWVPIPRELYRDFGLDPEDDAVRALHQVARHRGLAVLLLEVEDPGDRERARRITARLHRHNRGWPRLLVFTDAAYERWVFASWGVGNKATGLRLASLRRSDPGRAGLDLLAELAPGSTGSAAELAYRQAHALDKERVTRGFYRAIRGARDSLAHAWSGIAPGAKGERLELALLVLSRLLFLTFLQHKGWLDGDRHYLSNLFERAAAAGGRFYREALTPLFFHALNARPSARTASARRLGALPFLNGGLFQRYPIERQYPQLDAPDEPFADMLLQAFERYRFTVQEDTPLDRDAAVDPEMLGRVFEGLMKPATRARSGTFYTPTSLVTRLVNAALAAYLGRAAGLDGERATRLVARDDAVGLDARTRSRVLRELRRVRVLDAAVGSGAFLLVALQKIETLIRTLGGPVANPHALRREIVQDNLYGVDKDGSAVRLCELRLWLALVVDLEVTGIAAVPPLPNLDHKVRQGDALLDPLDLWRSWMQGPTGALDLWAESRRGLRAIEGLKIRYLNASGVNKDRWSHRLRSQERAWARRLLDRLETRAAAEIREWRALSRGRDLFGRRVQLDLTQRAALRRVHRARRELRALARRLADEGDLPFFSWTVHFAEVHARGGFDIVLGNPPWVRPHHVASAVRETLRARYRVARDAAWSPGVEHSGAGRGFG